MWQKILLAMLVYGLYGFMLGTIGLGLNNWEFWVLLLIAMVIDYMPR